MQEWLGNNVILMYSRHNESESVIAKRFIKTLKVKIYKKVTANDSRSSFSYLNKFVDQYNNTCDHSINKRPADANYSLLTEKLEANSKPPKFKVNLQSQIY